jgi:DNA polymerase III delta prime subunit
MTEEDDSMILTSSPSTSAEKGDSLPPLSLNPTQELAAQHFLHLIEDKHSIIIPSTNPPPPPPTAGTTTNTSKHVALIQGPPGTGKTSFLVALLVRILEQNPNQRTLVCAPSNKAILVIASRFMKAIKLKQQQQNGNEHGYNISLIGVEDKLIGESTGSDVDTGVDDIFVWSIVERLSQKVGSIMTSIDRGDDSDVLENFDFLISMITIQLPAVYGNHDIKGMLNTIRFSLQDGASFR